VSQRSGFHDLATRFREGSEFEVVTRQGASDAVILAIHGGRIEPGTTEIAEGVAGADHGLYLFKGRRPRANGALHLTSTRFDDPRALTLLAGARRVVSIHGCRGKDPFAVVGGRDREGSWRLTAALTAAGFDLLPAPARVRGCHRHNICNRGLGGRGIQLEISAGLRERLLGDLSFSPAEPTALLTGFCHTIREALQ
jgi:phage replication-related protein YjqB (UPF0714/DUF867 family)